MNAPHGAGPSTGRNSQKGTCLMRIATSSARLLAGLLLAASIAGCTLQADYVKADRLTKTAATPRLQQLAADHPDQKQDVDALLYTWEKRLATAEAAK